jgi:hypothetical protein
MSPLQKIKQMFKINPILDPLVPGKDLEIKPSRNGNRAMVIMIMPDKQLTATLSEKATAALKGSKSKKDLMALNLIYDQQVTKSGDIIDMLKLSAFEAMTE